MRTDVEDEQIKTGLLGTEQEKEAAICDAYERYKRPLAAFIREKVAPTLDSDEIATAINDVFCGLARYVSRGRFSRDGSLLTLLFSMARRKAYDRLRRKTKGQKACGQDHTEDADFDESLVVADEDADEEFAVYVAQKLSKAPELSAEWKNAADKAATNEIMRQFCMWIGTLPHLQRKVAEAVAKHYGDLTDAEICDEIAKTGERPTVASVKSARKQIVRKFTELMKTQERL